MNERKNEMINMKIIYNSKEEKRKNPNAKAITVKEAVEKANTKFVVVSGNGHILRINESIGSDEYNENKEVERIDIQYNTNNEPVITNIRI